jgi:hypothetical protein
MLKLDNNLLDELGLGALPEDQKKAMLQHIYETLELRVGTNLANQMTDQQLEEFEKFIDDGGDANQAQALQWLEANLPNYKQVVNEVFEALKGEIRQMAAQIMASSAPTAQPQQAAAPQPDPTMAAAVPQQPQYQPQAVPGPMPAQATTPPDYYQQPQQPVAQPQPAYQQPIPQQQPMPSAAAPYQHPYAPNTPQQQPGQYPVQQPPAGPGGYPQPPQQ